MQQLIAHHNPLRNEIIDPYSPFSTRSSERKDNFPAQFIGKRGRQSPTVNRAYLQQYSSLILMKIYKNSLILPE